MRQQTVIQMSVQRLACTACGAEAHASCNCGKPYVPAKQRAKEAIEANPQKSNRAIADDIGVSYETVRKARDATDNQLSVDEPRVGLDGKVRRLPVRFQEPEPDEGPDAEHEEGLRVIAARGFLFRASEAKQIADLGNLQTSDVTEAMIVAAEDAAAAWTTAARKLRSMMNG